MRTIIKRRNFLIDEQAVSEEFTVLPALSIVMIGFTLFVVLLAQTYTAYGERINQLQNYQTASSIVRKLTNPDCFFIRDGGLIDLFLLQNDTESLHLFCEQYQKSGIIFLVRLHWNNNTQDFPNTTISIPSNRIAISSNVGVYLNEGQTIPGTLTIIVWRDFL
jgi:hypothetical protein